MPPRQKSAPSWQRAYSGIATTCEVGFNMADPQKQLTQSTEGKIAGWDVATYA